MGLKLLILLLLLVMRSSLSEKADNHVSGHIGSEKPENQRFVQHNVPQSLRMKHEASILDKAEKSDRKSKKLRTVSANELEAEEAEEEYREEIIVMNERKKQKKKNALSFTGTNADEKNRHEVKSLDEIRVKRQAQELWIQREFHGYDDTLNLHAFIIRDEEVPQCGSAANKITNTRYFMCSGVILTKKFILTTASCVQYAHIFEHHIEASLSVLIGAVSNEAYVIKVKKFEMHPEHKNDAESTDYALHNLAIITIASITEQDLIFSIPAEVLVLPTFPARYEDVSHMCCSNTCQILTVVQTPNNRHKIQLMDAKYIPRAVHDHFMETNYLKRKKKRVPVARKIKRENKIAPPPVFFNNESPKNADTNKNSTNETTKHLTNLTENGLLEKITKDLMRGLLREKLSRNSNKPLTNNTQEIMRGFFRGNFDVDTNNPTENNNSGLSEEQARAISKFIKVITEKATSRVLAVLDETKKNKTFPSSKQNEEEMAENLVNNIAQIVKDDVLQEIDGSLNPRNLFNNTLPEPSSKYVHCPPLGTPIILNKTLIGLVAYTCDDLQSWVPWQYVNIDRNLKWIQDIIKGERNAFRKSQSTFGDDDNAQMFQWSDENDKKNNKHSEEPDNRSSDISSDNVERFKKDQQAGFKLSDKNRQRFNDIKPILTNFLKNHPNSLLINGTYREKLLSKRNDESPRVFVNKCFQRKDGTLNCQSKVISDKN